MYKTKRLVLRTAQEVTVESVLEYYLDNRSFLKPFEPLRAENFFTYRIQSINLSQDLIHIREHTGLKLYISKYDSSQIIGILNFSHIVMGAFCSCIVGYGLSEKYNGNGYMTEALNKGAQMMFDDYNLHRIEGNVMPRNTRSIKILESLGFEKEGLAKRYLKINGNWEDHIHFTLLNE